MTDWSFSYWWTCIYLLPNQRMTPLYCVIFRHTKAFRNKKTNRANYVTNFTFFVPEFRPLNTKQISLTPSKLPEHQANFPNTKQTSLTPSTSHSIFFPILLPVMTALRNGWGSKGAGFRKHKLRYRFFLVSSKLTAGPSTEPAPVFLSSG
jgi:hypothetical protein